MGIVSTARRDGLYSSISLVGAEAEVEWDCLPLRIGHVEHFDSSETPEQGTMVDEVESEFQSFVACVSASGCITCSHDFRNLRSSLVVVEHQSHNMREHRNQRSKYTLSQSACSTNQV